jgi:hypothetical protein
MSMNTLMMKAIICNPFSAIEEKLFQTPFFVPRICATSGFIYFKIELSFVINSLWGVIFRPANRSPAARSWRTATNLIAAAFRNLLKNYFPVF